MGKRLRCWLTVVSVLAALTRSAGADEWSWGQITDPTPPPARAIGGHARGCLQGAEPLPLDGIGYQVMRPSRQRFYGHPVAIGFVRELAAVMSAKGHRDLLIGDLTQPRGGPIPYGHRSHQTGLDIDIWFLAAPARRLSMQEREDAFAISMLAEQGSALAVGLWTDEQVELLRTAASFPQVDRIFVNAAIKQELCRTVADDRSWLAKIRPWWGHDDHFHVGLHCPDADTQCTNRQTPVPAGDGCDETLTWWFSDQAAEELRKSREVPPRLLTLEDLPPACRDVFEGQALYPAGADRS